MTLARSLLGVYEDSPSIQGFIEDMKFVEMMKIFLIEHIESGLSFFYPSALEGYHQLSIIETLEILLTLSVEDNLLVKEYTWTCVECGKNHSAERINEIFNFHNADCSFERPSSGEPLLSWVKENVYYQFRISDHIKPMILEEMEKAKNRKKIAKEGVDKHVK